MGFEHLMNCNITSIILGVYLIPPTHIAQAFCVIFKSDQNFLLILNDVLWFFFCIMTCFHIFRAYNLRRGVWEVHEESVYGFYGKLSRWHHKEYHGNALIYVRSTLFHIFCMKKMIFGITKPWRQCLGRREGSNLIFLSKLWFGAHNWCLQEHPFVIIVTQITRDMALGSALMLS